MRQTEKREPTAIERLQLEDCFERVENVRANDDVSIKLKRAKAKTTALAVALIALTVTVWEPEPREAFRTKRAPTLCKSCAASY